MSGNFSWIEKEFRGISINDKRLRDRFIRIAAATMESPAGSIAESTTDWGEAKAAYRLFDSDKLNKDEILARHAEKTIERTKALQPDEVVLAIQDTTTLNYTHHPSKEDVPKLLRSPGHSSDVKGFHLHHNFLMTEGGLPLGLLSQEP